LTVRLQKLKTSGERVVEKLEKIADSKNEQPKIAESEKSASEQRTNGQQEPAEAPASRPTNPLPDLDTAIPARIHDLEVELKKEMQEIQALKLALESGGMAPKERSETHQRFVGLLQHLKAMLTAYKDLRRDAGDGPIYKEQEAQGEELAALVEGVELG
jgi:hypothetical protein